ncbi:GntR family transcriptional regulator [Henriciella mobilis]|nr:GntR family transcriptional regulator [Henriciella mobilis]
MKRKAIWNSGSGQMNMQLSERRSTLAGKAGEVAEEMKRRLVLGIYKFGESISITDLANEMSASRQPVSAALSHLRTLGFVDIIPQVGCRVVSPGPEAIEDFFLAFGKIEGVFAAFAASRHRGDEAKDLIKIAEGPGPDALESLASRQDYINKLNDFHDQIRRMGRSPLVEARTASFRQLSIFYLWQGLPKMAPRSAKYFIGQRRQIAEAIAERDAKAAELLMAEHIAKKPQMSGLLERSAASDPDRTDHTPP